MMRRRCCRGTGHDPSRVQGAVRRRRGWRQHWPRSHRRARPEGHPAHRRVPRCLLSVHWRRDDAAAGAMTSAKKPRSACRATAALCRSRVRAAPSDAVAAGSAGRRHDRWRASAWPGAELAVSSSRCRHRRRARREGARSARPDRRSTSRLEKTRAARRRESPSPDSSSGCECAAPASHHSAACY